MSDWGAGFAIGIAVGLGLGMTMGRKQRPWLGLAIGVAAGRKQKPWSELTDREKKFRIAIMAALGVVVIAGLVVFLARM